MRREYRFNSAMTGDYLESRDGDQPTGHPPIPGFLLVAGYTQTVTRYVIDAATLVHLVDHDLTVDPSHRLVGPNSIRSEALQLLLDDVRSGNRTESEALATHEGITRLKIRLLGDRVSRATSWQIAVDHGWEKLRRAEYLAITRLQADALVTLDPDLAAKAHGVVPVAPLKALFSGQYINSPGGPGAGR